MRKDNVIELKKPETINDLLTEVIRSGARKLLSAAINAEVEEFLTQHNHHDEKARFVRNGYLPEREIQTGIGNVAVQVPRVRDRASTHDGIKFGSSVIPKYLRRSGNMNELLPLLYLKGISSNDFVDALTLLVGDGALGFWGALTEVYGKTRHQRCWFHKMGNVLDKLPKSLQAKAKSQLQEIWMSATREAAYKAFDNFVKMYESKHFKATECLLKDKEELLAFYDFPAEHWTHIRTSNPIESTFATVRHRTYKSKGCFSRVTILTMVFKLCESAQKRWNRLRGFNYLADVIRDVKFTNGIRQEDENGSVNERVAA